MTMSDHVVDQHGNMAAPIRGNGNRRPNHGANGSTRSRETVRKAEVNHMRVGLEEKG